jgi:hypothetical protein
MRSKRAISWLKLVLDHPASSRDTKDRAARLLARKEGLQASA